MGVIGVILLVVFVIVCLLIIALVLMQNEEGDGLGGLLSSGSNSAFGSRSAGVLTKITYVVVTLFFVTAFLLALINKSPSDKGLEEAAMTDQPQTETRFWESSDGTSDIYYEESTGPAEGEAPVMSSESAEIE
ncbi:preprotein translocase subunit SecG [Brucepastera parasyntrophica]|uniref:preprotein translocase subunit SecG n=1 Tax=Brucepastera parasyntrophica TaxID=2880008 RepID=UPI00210D425D|nr:preprotein translocase subunit SecG [Brucepastera parasyntrophica]ULQ60361.1 preprotein translocase subunit SecG [Brucepastera parasyntrophica]